VRRLVCLAALAGCSSDPRLTFEPCDTCVADPDTRCISLEQCEHDRECPTGTRCWDGSCKVVPRRQIQPRTLREDTFDMVSATLLQRGFGVGTMVIEPANGGSAIHFVEPNASIEEVVCALYRCMPEVVNRGQRDYGDLAGDGLVIDNYEKCVYSESGHITGGDRIYTPLDMVRSRAPNNATNDLSCPRDPDRVQSVGLVTELAFACLAFDRFDLVAASPFLPVAPEKLEGMLAGIPKDATCANDFDPCYEPPLDDRFGTCFGHVCRARCLGNTDCIAPGAHCEHEPSPPGSTPTQLVGVCTGS